MKKFFFIYLVTQISLFSELIPEKEMWSVDSFTDLPENKLLKNIFKMTPYQQASLKEKPWSGSPWFIFKGLIGMRYNDSLFPHHLLWHVNYAYVFHGPRLYSDIYQSNDFESIDLLSPAEKYDLLIGDPEQKLTRWNWKVGDELKKKGRMGEYSFLIELWAGVCHGWAPASMYVPKPKNAIYLKSVNNQIIRFYPEDIKALISYLWGYKAPNARFIGWRCRIKESGILNKIKDLLLLNFYKRSELSNCIDPNPGSFHMAMVNQIGVLKQPIIMDIVYDFEVWNQPIFQYKFLYYNLNNDEVSENPQSVMLEKNKIKKDPFKKYRTQYSYLVGVKMQVLYGYKQNSVIKGSLTEFDHPDRFKELNYDYDLELDSNGNIIGGEWHDQNRPDFLWNFPTNLKAETLIDKNLGPLKWNFNEPLPEEIAKNARLATENENAPLEKIVSELIRASRN